MSFKTHIHYCDLVTNLFTTITFVTIVMEDIIDSLNPQLLAVGYIGCVKYKLNIFSINATWTHGISLNHNGLPHVSSLYF
jgi:hypothetical protein